MSPDRPVGHMQNQKSKECFSRAAVTPSSSRSNKGDRQKEMKSPKTTPKWLFPLRTVRSASCGRKNLRSPFSVYMGYLSAAASL